VEYIAATSACQRVVAAGAVERVTADARYEVVGGAVADKILANDICHCDGEVLRVSGTFVIVTWTVTRYLPS